MLFFSNTNKTRKTSLCIGKVFITPQQKLSFVVVDFFFFLLYLPFDFLSSFLCSTL